MAENKVRRIFKSIASEETCQALLKDIKTIPEYLNHGMYQIEKKEMIKLIKKGINK